MNSQTPVRIAAFAIFASVLIATAPGASVVSAYSGTKVVVGSQHSTDTEFQNAKTLENASVQGSGESADVVANLGSSPAPDGNYVMNYTGGGNDDEIARNFSQSAVSTATVWANLSGYTSTQKRPQIRLYQQDGSKVITVGVDGNGDILSYDGSSWVDTGIDAEQDVWLEFEFSNIDYSAQTYDLTVKYKNGSTVGSTTGVDFEGSGSKIGRIQLFGEDNVWQLDAIQTAGTMRDSFEDGDLSEWSGSSKYTTEKVGSGHQRAVYVSQNHSIEESQEAAINITLDNASATVTVTGVDGSDTQLNQTTFTSSGNHTITWSSYSGSEVEVNITFNKTGDNPTGKLHDESILFTNHAPSVDNSSASPSGGEKLTASTVTLSIDISDQEFGTAQGESVTAKFYVKAPNESSFSKVGEDTLSSNGTASLDYTASDGGDYEWYVVAEDSYGGTIQSKTFNFTTPSKLYVRPVNQPNTTIDVNGTISATFYSKDGTTVVEKTSDNGTFNLTGLPVDKKMVAVVEADGYHTRSVIIADIFAQQSIYLLSTNKTSVDVTFQLDDQTGEFTESGTELILQRAITRNNTTKWRIVMGAEIGASLQAPTTLEKDVRYRIIVRNGEQRRVLGQYLADNSADPEILPIGKIDISGSVDQGLLFGATGLETDTKWAIQYAYRDPANNTTELRVRIYNVSNSSNKLYDVTNTDVGELVVESVDLTGHSPAARYKVVFNASLANGKSVGSIRYVGGPGEVGCMGLGSTVCELGSYLLILLSVGFVGIYDPAGGVAAGTITAAGLTVGGMVTIGPIPLGVAGGLAILMHFGRQ